MTKAKETKAPTRKTALDQIVTQLLSMLRRETTDVVLAGNLLIESRKHLSHGEWKPWLAENFDLSYRTALRYISAAEYVAKKQKCHAVSLFANLSPTVLYALSEGVYYSDEQTAILAAAREGRVDQARAATICIALRPPPPPPSPGASHPPPEDADKDHLVLWPRDSSAPPPSQPAGDDSPDAILDGPPPAVPPPPPIATPDFTLHTFDQAVAALKSIMTKRTSQFVRTAHSAGDLEAIAAFIQAVSRVRCGASK